MVFCPLACLVRITTVKVEYYRVAIDKSLSRMASFQTEQSVSPAAFPKLTTHCHCPTPKAIVKQVPSIRHRGGWIRFPQLSLHQRKPLLQHGMRHQYRLYGKNFPDIVILTRSPF